MARQRLGVVLRVPQPLATEIDGLRRAAGDPMLGRVASHLTLVPPVNVHDRDLPAAIERVRHAAAVIEPITVRLGPGATFLPDEPVLYLAVSGDLDRFEQLRRGLLQPPLQRRVHDPWVPHVTVSANLDPDRIPGALDLLADFEVTVRFDRVLLLSEGEGRVWHEVADADLGQRPVTVGRGSLPLELRLSTRLDLEAAALLAAEAEPLGRPWAVSARRDHGIVAAAWGWSSGVRAEIADLVVATDHRRTGIGRHVLAAVEDVGRRRGCTQLGVLAPASGAAAALLASGGWDAVSEPDEDGRRRWERQLRT